MEGQALRLAAGRGHDEDVGIAFVLAGEGDPLAVRTELGKAFIAVVRGDAGGHAAGKRRFPQIAFRGEDYGVAVDGGEAVIADDIGGGGSVKRHQRDRRKGDRSATDRKRTGERTSGKAHRMTP